MGINPGITGLAVLTAGLVMGAAAWASEAGGHGGITPAKIEDFIYRTMNFAVFAGVLYYLLAKPIKNFFAGRRQEIAQSLADLEKQKVQAQKALRAAKAQLAAVADERDQIIQQFIVEGEAEKAKIIQRAEMAAERLKELAAMTITQETKKAAAELKREIVETAVQLSEDLIKEKIMADDQQRLVDDYLTKVVSVH
jgi:F-type H+-transporting ATPase subunit b